MVNVEEVKKELTFKDVFKLPLKMDEISTAMVLTDDDNRAFDFSETRGVLNKKNNLKILSEINNPSSVHILNKLTYENGTIKVHVINNIKDLLTLRSWGRLTSTNGLNLSQEQATKLQDDFAAYIIECLTKDNT